MRNNWSLKTVTAKVPLRHIGVIIALLALGAQAEDGRYRQLNLVSDQPGAAMLLDTNLVNAWGISFGPNGPFWVSANGSGLALLYVVTADASGNLQVTKRPLEVTIPGDGTPTGQLFNDTEAFHTNLFIFASEDGTISGWRPALGTDAEVLVPADDANVYKGITLVKTDDGPMLLAANFRHGTVDAYDADLTLVGQFSDPDAPQGYAPFNVQNLHGVTFVTYAKQDADKHDDVAGPGNGLIDVFIPETGEFLRFATGRDAGGKLREINSPWGLAVAPSDFGTHSDELLVGNFGSGTIMTFHEGAKFRGLLKGTDNHPIVIDGLWGLKFGDGTNTGKPNILFFSAGPDGESHGLFGAIESVKEPGSKSKGKGKDK